MIYENMKSELALKLRHNYTVEQTADIMRCLDTVMVNYDLSSKETALTTRQGMQDMLLDLYFATERQHWLSPNTEDNRRSCLLGEFGLFTLTGKSPAEMTSLDILAYFPRSQDCRKIAGVKPASNETLNKYWAAANCCYTWAVKRSLLKENPMIFVPKFPEAHKMRDYLTRDEAEELRAACKNSRQRAIIETLLCTGMRRSELADVQIGDIDFSERIIKIRCGKNHKSRKVTFNSRCRQMLLEYFKTCEPFKSNPTPSEDTYLFPKSRSPYSKCNGHDIGAVVIDVVKRTGISTKKHITAHSLRHTCATNLLQSQPIQNVSMFLGHSNIGTTQIYNNTPTEKILSEIRDIAV